MKPSTCQPAKKKRNIFLILPLGKAVRYFGDEYPSKHKDKFLRSAEVGRSYFKLVSHLRGFISVEWSDSVELEGKKTQNKHFLLRIDPCVHLPLAGSALSSFVTFSSYL